MEHMNKILIVSKSESTADQISRAFPGDAASDLDIETSTFAAMNGHASEIAMLHNVVIFDADPDDEAEVASIQAMLSGRPAGAFYIALTDEDVSIAKARRLREAGIDEVLPNTISKDELHRLVERTLAARKAVEKTHTKTETGEGMVICVAQARGGIGSTTVAVNLARKLAGEASFLRRSKTSRVALVDLDLQFGNANVFLDVEDNGGFLRLLELSDAPDENYLRGLMIKHPSGIEILAAPQPIAPLHSLHSEVMASLFDLLKANYDYIIVDLPRALVEWVEPVIARASRLEMVMDTSVPSVRQAKRLVDFYKEANISLAVDFIVNHETKPFMRSDAQREAESVLETKFQHWIPDNPKVARKAVDLGKPVTEMSANSDMGKAFKKLATVIQEAAMASKGKTA